MRLYLIFFMLLVSSNSTAQWSDNPTENTFISFTESIGTTDFKAISDGNGGTFILIKILDDLLKNVLILERLNKFGQNMSQTSPDFANSEHFPVTDEMAMAQADNNGVFVVYDERRGFSPNYSHHILVHKVDSSLSKLWSDSGLEITATGSELILKTVSRDEDGGIIIAWREDSILRAQRIDSEGAFLWGINGIIITQSLAAESVGGSKIHSFYVNGNFYISYVEEAESPTRKVQKFNSLGTLLWDMGVDVSVSDNMIIDGENGIVTAGRLRQIAGTDTVYSIVAHRIDGDGNKLWGENGIIVSVNATIETENVEIASNGLDEYILVWQSAHTGNTNIYAQKLLFDGQILWTNGDVAVGDPSVNNFIDARNGTVTDGNLNTIVLWRTDQNQRKGIFGQMIDKDGEKSWGSSEVILSDRNSGSISSKPHAVSDNNGGVIGTWFEKAFEAVWAQRVDRQGVLGDQLIVSAKDETIVEVPKAYQLFPNFPNPFNPITKINYQLPKSTHVSLVVYNLKGQEVVRLVDTSQAAGFYTVKWDASGLASGVYVYRITAGSFTDAKRMVLIK